MGSQTLAPDSEQLSLSAEITDAGMELLAVDQDARAGRCTGARLAARTEMRDGILAALAEGAVGTRRIAAMFGVSREAVRALRARAVQSGDLDQIKQRLGRSFLALAEAASDRMLDEIDEMPRASLPIVGGVATDKGQLLTGGVTARVERLDGLTAESVNALIDSLPVLEVVASPVEPGAAISQKAAGALEVVGLDAAAIGAGQSESPAFCPTHEGAAGGRAGVGQIEGKKGGES
jgi:hypothetical protein